MNLTLIIAVIGAATGLTGAVLGVINTIHALNRSKVRIIIEPKYYIMSHGKMFSFTNVEDRELLKNNPDLISKIDGISLHIKNISDFSVSISEIGFLAKDSSTRYNIDRYFTEKGLHLPIRMEPRSSVSFFTDPRYKENCISTNFKSAYAHTECGESFKKTCNHLKLHLVAGKI